MQLKWAITRAKAESPVLLWELFLSQFLVSQLLVVLIAVALVAKALWIAHSVRVLACSGSGFSAVQAIAPFAHSFSIMCHICVSAIHNLFQLARLDFPLLPNYAAIFLFGLVYWGDLGYLLWGTQWLLMFIFFLIRIYIWVRIGLFVISTFFVYLWQSQSHILHDFDLIQFEIEAGNQLFALRYGLLNLGFLKLEYLGEVVVRAFKYVRLVHNKLR